MFFLISRSKLVVPVFNFRTAGRRVMKVIYFVLFYQFEAITLDACNKFLNKQAKDVSTSSALEHDLKRCDNLRVRDEQVRVRNALNFFKRLTRHLKLLQAKIKVMTLIWKSYLLIFRQFSSKIECSHYPILMDATEALISIPVNILSTRKRLLISNNIFIIKYFHNLS